MAFSLFVDHYEITSSLLVIIWKVSKGKKVPFNGNHSNANKTHGDCPDKEALKQMPTLHVLRYELVLNTPEVHMLAFGGSAL